MCDNQFYRFLECGCDRAVEVRQYATALVRGEMYNTVNRDRAQNVKDTK